MENIENSRGTKNNEDINSVGEADKKAESLDEVSDEANSSPTEPTPIITQSTAQDIENEFENKEIESIEKVEAALFISGRFLSINELIVLTDVNPIMIREILRKLEKKYERLNGVIRLVNRSNSWKMDVAERYHYLINRLATGSLEFTKAEQETLAIIAYKQPISSVFTNFDPKFFAPAAFPVFFGV